MKHTIYLYYAYCIYLKKQTKIDCDLCFFWSNLSQYYSVLHTHMCNGCAMLISTIMLLHTHIPDKYLTRKHSLWYLSKYVVKAFLDLTAANIIVCCTHIYAMDAQLYYAHESQYMYVHQANISDRNLEKDCNL